MKYSLPGSLLAALLMAVTPSLAAAQLRGIPNTRGDHRGQQSQRGQQEQRGQHGDDRDDGDQDDHDDGDQDDHDDGDQNDNDDNVVGQRRTSTRCVDVNGDGRCDLSSSKVKQRRSRSGNEITQAQLRRMLQSYALRMRGN